jgi:hypothetical protein
VELRGVALRVGVHEQTPALAEPAFAAIGPERAALRFVQAAARQRDFHGV